jgi:hypothetical protein
VADGLIGAVIVHIERALAAGVLGSAIGTAIAVCVIMPVRMMLVDGHLEPTIGAAPFLFGFSLMFTLPSAVLIAAPMVWPLREWSVRHPWRGASLYGVIGAVAGVAVIALLDRSAPIMAVIYGAAFGASTGAAFIALLNWTRMRAEIAADAETVAD